jgi:hypothetical protein
MKQALLNRNLPLYGSIGTAANAAAKAIWYYNNRRRAMEAICQ